MKTRLLSSAIALVLLAATASARDPFEDFGGFELDGILYVHANVKTKGHPNGMVPVPIRLTHSHADQTVLHFRMPQVTPAWKEAVLDPWLDQQSPRPQVAPADYAPEFFGYTVGHVFKKPSETITLLPNATAEQRAAIYHGAPGLVAAMKDYKVDAKARDYIVSTLAQDPKAAPFLFSLQAAQRLLSPPGLLEGVVDMSDQKFELLGPHTNAELLRPDGQTVHVREYAFKTPNDSAKRYGPSRLPWSPVALPPASDKEALPVVRVEGMELPIGAVRLVVRDAPLRPEDGNIEELSFFAQTDGAQDAKAMMREELLVAKLVALHVGDIPSEMPPEGW